MTGQAEGSAGAAQSVLDFAVASRLGRKGVPQLVRTLRESLRLVRLGGRRAALVSAALQALAALILLVQLLLARAVLQNLRAEGLVGDQTDFALLLVAFASAIALGQAVSAMSTQHQRVLGERVTRHVWALLLDVASRVPLSVAEEPAFHERLERVRTFAVVRPIEVTSSLSSIVSAGLTSAALLGVLLVLEPLLVPLLVVAGVPLLLLSRRSSKAEFLFAVRQTLNLRRRGYLTRLLTEDAAAKEVRAFDLSGALRGRYLSLYDAFIKDTRVHARQQSRAALLEAVVSAVALSGTLLLMLALVQSGRLGLPEAAVAAVVLRLLTSRVQALASSVARLFGAGLFLDDLLTFLQQPVMAERTPRLAARAQLTLRAEGLTFRYPGADHDAVRGLDLDLAPGQIVALVGENGSGKTTVAKLLAGLYEPTAGRLAWAVDGQGVPADEVRDHLTVLFQDFGRYELSARDNVALGRVHVPVDDERVRAALRTADAWDTVTDLPQGLDTVLSKAYPGGRDLSGGQWQRIALARCFYRDAPLVILDEPTSALDPRAEHELFAGLRTLLSGRSVVLVSHRFSNVRSADRILVLRDGVVVEDGDHEELMARGGVYAGLYLMQARAYGLQDEAEIVP